MVIRAKTKMLFEGKPLTEKQKKNTELNLNEIRENKTILESYPRRLVFELTNACNLNCIMCGRNAADFKLTSFDMDIFRSFEPMMDTIEEVTLMGWGEPTIHPDFNEMLEIIGIDKTKLPVVRESCEVIGNIRRELANKFGLNDDVKIVIGEETMPARR